jgi:adenine deaminase
MNYPGVINQDKEVTMKIYSAKKFGKPIDGHAPDLTGDNLKKYASSGITTDHECFTQKEAVEKIKNGMKILVTGGAGFIGSHLVERLVRLKADVATFVRYNSRNERGLLAGMYFNLASFYRTTGDDEEERHFTERLFR